MANYAPPSTGVYFGGQKIGTVTNMSMRLPKKNNKILFQTLDLRVSHKTKVFPSQIVVKGGKFITPGPGGNKSGYYVVDSATNRPYFFTHYEISRYYLGKSYRKYSIKGNRISLPTFEITSNPTVFWKDIRIKKFNVLDRAKERMIAALSDQEKKAYDRAVQKRINNPPINVPSVFGESIEGWLDLPEEE